MNSQVFWWIICYVPFSREKSFHKKKKRGHFAKSEARQKKGNVVFFFNSSLTIMTWWMTLKENLHRFETFIWYYNPQNKQNSDWECKKMKKKTAFLRCPPRSNNLPSSSRRVVNIVVFDAGGRPKARHCLRRLCEIRCKSEIFLSIELPFVLTYLHGRAPSKSWCTVCHFINSIPIVRGMPSSNNGTGDFGRRYFRDFGIIKGKI